MSFDELRTGFTAAVSHELRTPLARILALLDSTDLPGADVHALIDQARAEVENAGTLIDEILFLSELESGTRGRRARPHERAAGPAGGARRARGRGRPRRRRRSGRDRRPRRRPAAAAADAADRRREPGRERDPLRGPRLDVRLAVGREDGVTTLDGSRRRRRRLGGATSRGCSSASGAPTPRAPRAAPGSASRSSSTSSRRPAAPSRRAASAARPRGALRLP